MLLRVPDDDREELALRATHVADGGGRWELLGDRRRGVERSAWKESQLGAQRVVEGEPGPRPRVQDLL